MHTLWKNDLGMKNFWFHVFLGSLPGSVTISYMQGDVDI